MKFQKFHTEMKDGEISISKSWMLRERYPGTPVLEGITSHSDPRQILLHPAVYMEVMYGAKPNDVKLFLMLSLRITWEGRAA